MTAQTSRRLVGHPIVVDARSLDLGGFYEVIAASALDRVLAEKSDVLALVAHRAHAVLARTTSGTLQLERDRIGLRAVIDLPHTSLANDTAELVRRGDWCGMSFSFVALSDVWDFSGAVPVRTVMDMTVKEISVCTWPAYPSTSVTVERARSVSGQARQWAKPWQPSIAFRERMLRVHPPFPLARSQ
jgi:HK97 family phage prohead protease